MLPMHKTIVSDTSCLIILTNIGELELLHKLYGQITTTKDIAAEYGEPLPEWVEIVNATDKSKQLLLELQIDKGESSAIALALEIPNSTVILDDNKARKVAQQLGLNYTGTIGVIVKAKLQGLIPSIKPIIAKIKHTYKDYDVKQLFDDELKNWISVDEIGDNWEDIYDWFYDNHEKESLTEEVIAKKTELILSVSEVVVDQLMDWYEKEFKENLSDEQREDLSKRIIETYPALDPNNY